MNLEQKNGEKPIAYCLRGCYLCFSLIYSRRLIHRKGMAMTPTFHEVPNLPRDRESYSVSIRKQHKWGFELTYLWQASKGEELVCVRLHWPRHLVQRGAHKIVKGIKYSDVHESVEKWVFCLSFHWLIVLLTWKQFFLLTCEQSCGNAFRFSSVITQNRNPSTVVPTEW